MPLNYHRMALALFSHFCHRMAFTLQSHLLCFWVVGSPRRCTLMLHMFLGSFEHLRFDVYMYTHWPLGALALYQRISPPRLPQIYLCVLFRPS